MPNRYRRSVELALLISMLQPVSAGAQTTVTLTGTGAYSYDSNVFDIEPGYPLPGFGARSGTSDVYHSETAELDVKYQTGQQSLHGDLSGTDLAYQRFTQLNHQEYKLDTGWSGTFASLWDGSFDVMRDRSMVPFLDVTQSTLSMTTEQREQATLGLQFEPQWRLETSAYTRTVDWPLPGVPDLKVSESQGQAILNYLGTAAVTSGISASYLGGSYSGSPDPAANPTYRQWTTEMVVDYKSGHSTLLGHIGYGDRTSTGVTSALNSAAGVTGGVTYTNQVTGKTTVSFDLARVFNNFITDEGSEIDNTATLALSWQATYKIRLDAGYTWDYAQYPGQGNNPPGSDRLDHLRTTTFGIDYEALTWLSIKPYANYQTRSSDFLGGNFNASIYGVNITLQTQE